MVVLVETPLPLRDRTPRGRRTEGERGASKDAGERTMGHSRGGCCQGLSVISVLLGVLQAELFSVIFYQVLLVSTSREHFLISAPKVVFTSYEMKRNCVLKNNLGRKQYRAQKTAQSGTCLPCQCNHLSSHNPQQARVMVCSCNPSAGRSEAGNP